jgi:hypothetical protein
MNTLYFILGVWAGAAAVCVLFIHGATRPTTRKEQRQMYLRGEGI